MDRWLTTAQAAEVLGTTSTTVRKLALEGVLDCKITPRPRRQRWSISEHSVHAYLAQHGRIDLRRRKRTAPASSDALVAAIRLERDRLRDENAALRDVALRLRVRNDAVATAEAHQARAAELLLRGLTEQASAAAHLRRAIAEQDEALGQFLTPGAAAISDYEADSPAKAAPTA